MAPWQWRRPAKPPGTWPCVIDLDHVTAWDFRSLAPTDRHSACVKSFVDTARRYLWTTGDEFSRRLSGRSTARHGPRVAFVVIVFQRHVTRAPVYLSPAYLCLSHLYAESVPQRHAAVWKKRSRSSVSQSVRPSVRPNVDHTQRIGVQNFDRHANSHACMHR